MPFTPSVLSRTQRELLRERFTLGHLVGQRWRSCAVTDSVSVVPRGDCSASAEPGAAALTRISELAASIEKPSGAQPSTEALRAEALIALRMQHRSKMGLENAIKSLEEARRASNDDAEVLNDLAVAYLATGQRDQSLLPVLRALNTVNLAIRHDATLAPARFNRALILESLYLVADARQAWKVFLASDASREWMAEGREHLHSLDRFDDTLTAALYPQRERERVFKLLGTWGSATLEGNATLADSIAALGRRIADSTNVLTPDRSVRYAVELLDRAGSARDRDIAARASVAFSRAINAHDNSLYEECERSMIEAERGLVMLNSPTARWATLYRAACELGLGRFETADERLKQIVRTAGPAEPAVVGKAIWVRGVTAARLGDGERSNILYAQSREYFESAGDIKNKAAISYLLCEGLEGAGQMSLSLAEGYRGLRGMASHRQSNYLHNHLLVVANLARTHGLRHAAVDFVSEALSIDSSLKRLNPLAFALWTRADDFAAVGDTDQAIAELKAAEAVAVRLEGVRRTRTLADITFIRGRLLRDRDPRQSAALLADVITTYRATKAWLWLPSALYHKATVARSTGDSVLARQLLAEAIDEIERQQSSFTSAAGRSAFYETAENVFDTAMEMELSAGRPAEAYALLERARATVWAKSASRMSRKTEPAVASSLAHTAALLPADMLYVAYAVLPERLAIWYASRRGTGQVSVPVTRDSIVALVAALVRTSPGRVLDNATAMSATYAVVFAPIEAQLRQAGGLVIVPDRELTELPFAALRDPMSKRFVLEDHVVRMVPSSAFLEAVVRGGPASRGAAGLPALVVGDPLLAANDSTGLPPLPGAAAEARRVAAVLVRSQLLSGSAATRSTVTGALPRNSLFHFAGHAVFNSDQPDLSYLAMASDGDSSSGRLYAREIAAMSLSKLGMVVLSGCSTLRARSSHTGAVSGLAYSFLYAGAPATISTLWEISDDNTAELLLEFHQRRAQGESGADALRSAQLSALRSARANKRSPAAWAAFIYTGL